MKLIVSLFALIFALSFGQAHAMQATPSSGSGGSFGYTCTSAPTSTCSCAGVDDCIAMDDAGVCNREDSDGSVVNDISCTPGFGSCSCTWQPSQGAARDLRPQTQSTGTDMAPADEALSPRERRNRLRTSPVTQPQANRTRRDHRSDSSNDDAEAEDDSETVIIRRDHRRPRSSNPDPN